MHRLVLLTLLALTSCTDIALTLPSTSTREIFLGCSARAPIGECAPTGRAVIVRHRWSF